MSLDLTKMTRVIVELSLVLILTVHGVLGAEMAIKASVGTSATVQCKEDEDLMRCRCPSPLQRCTNCTGVQPVTAPLEISVNTSEKYLTFVGLQTSTSGMYTCFPKNIHDKRVTRKYWINVTQDRDPTVVIGTLGNPTRLTCGTGLDLFAASDKKWCRLDESAVCQENTIMGPGGTTGNFEVHNTQNAFILENRNLTHDTAGQYKCTLDFPDQNQTQIFVNLQVIDSPRLLKIHHAQIWPKGGQPFMMTCPYPQKLKFGYSKSWRCDNTDCPETVKSTDDHFQSALVLTIDHITCTKIRSFQCVMKSSKSSEYSNIYRHPLMMAPPTVVYFSYDKYQTQVVYAYTVLNMVCSKPYRAWDYEFGGYYFGSRYRPNYHNIRGKATICKKKKNQCVDMKVEDKPQAVEFKLCVTPEDNGTVYRCDGGYTTYYVTIYIKERPPPAKPRQTPPPPGQRINSNMVIVVVVTIIILLMLTMSIGINHCKTRSLRQWYRALFARRAPLSAVDAHANMYANAIAQYYSQQRSAITTSTAGGNTEEPSSSSDDEFEELPVPQNPSLNINKDKNEYVMVKLPEPGPVPSGEQVQDEAERDEDEDITYTHVIIQPKTHQRK